MSKLPQALIDIFKEIGLTKEQATWDCHGTPVALHKALEQVAAHQGITFDAPKIVESDPALRSCVLIVTGRLKDKSEWSIGEAMPINIDRGSHKQSYPYAMAEKRAKDRVILKLIGVAGFVYSEAEAAAFEESRPDNISGAPQTNVPPPASDDIPFNGNWWEQWVIKQKGLIDEADSIGACTAWVNRTREKRDDLKEFSRELTAELRDYYSAKYDKLNNGER
tara:strand:+ start:49 stop:714 length:666 start_codon:yes stop_codon:yes gene_type:complete